MVFFYWFGFFQRYLFKRKNVTISLEFTMHNIKFLEPTDITDIGDRYSHYPGPYAIDKPDLEKMFPGILKTKSEEYTNEKHNYKKGDLDNQNVAFINQLVAYMKPSIILEIGTYRGRTTYNMAKNSEHSNIITIDIANLDTNTYSSVDMKYHQKTEKVGEYFKNTKAGEKITQIIADSLTPECQILLDAELSILAPMGNKKIDFAFIDAGHDYDSVRHNFEELVLPRMKQGGVVVFDDYNRPLSIVGVTHYLLKKAYEDGYVFYWYAPRNEKHTHEVIFLNLAQSRRHTWRQK